MRTPSRTERRPVKACGVVADTSASPDVANVDTM
jgi:hypothetical protein